MSPSDEIVENRDNMSYVSENEPKQTVSMAGHILLMLCFYALSYVFIYKEHIEIKGNSAVFYLGSTISTNQVTLNAVSFVLSL